MKTPATPPHSRRAERGSGKEEGERKARRKNPRMLNQSLSVETSGTVILCVYEYMLFVP